MPTERDATDEETSPPGSHRGWLLFAYVAILFVGSHIPHEKASIPQMGVDKVIHLVAFAILGWLACRWWFQRGRAIGSAAVAGLFGAIMAYGFFDEVTQPPFRRTFDPFDLVADAIGAAFGIALFVGLRSRRRDP
ncbi:MAG: VanZ family protein [Planctomycetota bacterium]